MPYIYLNYVFSQVRCKDEEFQYSTRGTSALRFKLISNNQIVLPSNTTIRYSNNRLLWIKLMTRLRGKHIMNSNPRAKQVTFG